MGVSPVCAGRVFGDVPPKKLAVFSAAVEDCHFHLVSSIAVLCLYEGLLCEDMFDDAKNCQYPYFITQHESEKIVSAQCWLPWPMYRRALVVGDSTTGKMDKVDEQRYVFKLM